MLVREASAIALQWVIEPELEHEVAEQIGNDRDCHVPSFVVVSATRL
jgi:hypothetical protein